MLARKSVYWRGINSDIERTVSGCEQCILRRKAPAREPLLPHDIPDRPWQKVGIDIFTANGIKYQLVTDYFSKWIEVERIPNNAISEKLAVQDVYPIFIFSAACKCQKQLQI